MLCRAALLPHLEAAGHGQPQRSHRKAEKLRAAQLPVVGQTEEEPHTSGSQSRHDGAWAGQRRQRGSDPAVGSGLQPDRALLHPGTDTCAGTGSVTLAIQVHPSLNAEIILNADTAHKTPLRIPVSSPGLTQARASIVPLVPDSLWTPASLEPRSAMAPVLDRLLWKGEASEQSLLEAAVSQLLSSL